MIQLWSAIAVAILTVIIGPLLRGEVNGRLLKRISSHAELRTHLDGNEAARQELDQLLTAEIGALRLREEHRLTRKLNGANVAALVIVAVFGAAAVYALVTWALAVWTPAPVAAVVLFVVAAIAGLLTIALAAVGMGTLYAPPKTKEERAAAKTAKAQR